jgi:hypothetical protein
VEDQKATLNVLSGQIALSKFTLTGAGTAKLKDAVIQAGESRVIDSLGKGDL